MTNPTRDGLGMALEQLESKASPWVVTADLVDPLGLRPYWESHPGRTVNTGVAEQLMVAVASGIASVEGTAVCATFASFLLRATEQLRTFLSVDRLPVLAVGGHAGLATGPNGVTHQSIEDLAVMASLGIESWSPATADEVVQIVNSYLGSPRPMYLRLARWTPDVTIPSFSSSSVTEMESGSSCSITLLTHGVGTSLGQIAIHKLRQRGVRCGQLHIGRLHPFPASEVSALVGDGPAVIVEDHLPEGALATHARLALPGRELLAISPTTFGSSDDPEILFHSIGMSPTLIADAVEAFLASSK